MNTTAAKESSDYWNLVNQQSMMLDSLFSQSVTSPQPQAAPQISTANQRVSTNNNDLLDPFSALFGSVGLP
jgi:hypothetical protein